MTLKTSLIITGDSEQAQAAVDDLKASVDKLASSNANGTRAQRELSKAMDAGILTAREQAALGGAISTSNTALAGTSRIAAAGQIALAGASEVATGALAGLGVSAMTVEAILTGGLSLALTAGIGFLAGFGDELFSMGSEADSAAPKVDRLTEALQRLHAEQANAADIGEVEKKLNALRDDRLKASIAKDKAANTRAGAQERAAATRQIASLDAEIASLSGAIAMNEAVAKSHDKVTEATTKSTAAVRQHSSARRAANDADRAAADAAKKLQADLEGVIGRYDPARKAASDYADELERIARLSSNGKITTEQATDYRAQASANYMSKAIDIGGIKDLADQEKAAIDASGAIDKIVQSINDETAALGILNPVQRELLNYREQLAALSPEEQAAAEARIRGALDEKAATEEVARATEEARRAQEQLGNMAVDAFTAIVTGGEKASDVIDRLGETIAAAAVQATLFGTGPLAAMLGGAVAPSTGGSSQSLVTDQANKSLAKTLSGEIETSMDKVFGTKGSFGKTLQNAGLGYAAGGMTGSKTGGALGGMIGGAVGKELLGSALGSLGQFAGPIGAIAGGLLGGAIGGLLKKTKTGAANITSVDSDATLSGNSAQFKAAASGAAGSVQDGLSSIAEQLGGSIGSFNVTIGQRHGDWRVRSGTGSLKVAKGATEFDDDQAGAIAYAMQLAISQGAVTGLSAAVSKALNSSSDLDTALTEALKVQEVETLLGGISAEMASQFKTLETQAKERLRIATQYGFDVVEIEKKNAEDRVALVDQILTSRIGSLQDLLDDLNFGDLYEGSLTDQRTALLAEIAKARASAEAGDDGAADTLASLSRQLIELSREAYGTAGSEYASDRDSAISDAMSVIKAETNRVNEAQGLSTEAVSELKTSNDIANEQADQLADMGSTLKEILSVLTPSSSPLVPDVNLVLVSRGLK